MAWTSFPAGLFTSGDILTAAQLNTYVRDNLTAGHDLVSSLPGSPVDGQTIYYQTSGMETLGVVWTLRYRSGSSSSYKWEFVGGPPMHEQVMASGTTTTTSSGGGTITGGPSMTIPLAGEYLVTFGANITTASGFAVVLADYNGSVISNWGRFSAYNTFDQEGGHNVGTNQISIMSQRAFLASTAGNTLTLKYRTDGGTASFQRRFMNVTPVRLG